MTLAAFLIGVAIDVSLDLFEIFGHIGNYIILSSELTVRTSELLVNLRPPFVELLDVAQRSRLALLSIEKVERDCALAGAAVNRASLLEAGDPSLGGGHTPFYVGHATIDLS
jgi:hypothetical protein